MRPEKEPALVRQTRQARRCRRWKAASGGGEAAGSQPPGSFTSEECARKPACTGKPAQMEGNHKKILLGAVFSSLRSLLPEKESCMKSKAQNGEENKTKINLQDFAARFRRKHCYPPRTEAMGRNTYHKNLYALRHDRRVSTGSPNVFVSMPFEKHLILLISTPPRPLETWPSRGGRTRGGESKIQIWYRCISDSPPSREMSSVSFRWTGKMNRMR